MVNWLMVQLPWISFFVVVAAIACSCERSVTDEFTFDGPTHIVELIDGSVAVSDGYGNARVAIFDPEGRFVRSFGSRGFGRGQFNNPHGLGVLSDGRLLVCDRDNARIQMFSPDGDFLDMWQSSVRGRPWSVAVAAGDTVFALDGGDQRSSEPRAGIVQLTAHGAVVQRFSMYGTESGSLNWAHSIGVDHKGNIYVVDLRNERLQRFDKQSSNTFRINAQWSEQATRRVRKPLSLVVKDSSLYVSQDISGAPIRHISTETGTDKGTIADGLFERVHGMMIDRKNRLWVVDVDRNVVARLAPNGQPELELGQGGLR